MARIPYPDLAKVPQATRDALAKRRPLNVYRMLAHAETVVPPMIEMVNAMLCRTALDPRLRELVILRVGHLCGSAYEVKAHDRIAREAGASEADLEAVKTEAGVRSLGRREQIVLRFAEELTHGIKVSDKTFAQAASILTERDLVELTIVAGFYNMVSRVLETLAIEIERST
jgi:AhpD family alkylhydroperoxidase